MNNMQYQFHSQKGITAVEILIAVSIAAVVLITASYSIFNFVNSAREVAEKTQALYLAEDGLELIRYVRDNAWTNISTLSLNTPYYLDATSSYVHITTSPETVGDFSRSIAFQNVYRDSTTDDIVASTTSGSVADNNSKYVTVTVTWGSPTKTVSLSSILVNLNP